MDEAAINDDTDARAQVERRTLIRVLLARASCFCVRPRITRSSVEALGGELELFAEVEGSRYRLHVPRGS